MSTSCSRYERYRSCVLTLVILNIHNEFHCLRVAWMQDQATFLAKALGLELVNVEHSDTAADAKVHIWPD